MYPSSVVQTGVKSLGCEKSIAQPSPIHSWKLMGPWVVSALKFGASLLILRAMIHLAIHFYLNVRFYRIWMVVKNVRRRGSANWIWLADPPTLTAVDRSVCF